jgi:phosphatidylglycerophosphate synthase
VIPFQLKLIGWLKQYRRRRYNAALWPLYPSNPHDKNGALVEKLGFGKSRSKNFVPLTCPQRGRVGLSVGREMSLKFVCSIPTLVIPLLGKLRAKYEAAMQPLGTKLGEMGARPNAITTVSLSVSFVAATAYALRYPVFGAVGLVATGLVDMLDGAVARATGSATRFGAVYDHVLDRYAEFAVLLGMGFGRLVDWPWIVFGLFGMVMASYARAKAESVGGLSSCTVGIAERQEKIIVLLVGSFLQPFIGIALTVSVAIAGLLSHVTVVQRLWYTHENARGSNVAV